MATEVMDRSAFIRPWCDRKGDDDPFDKFYSLWLALVICACHGVIRDSGFRRFGTACGVQAGFRAGGTKCHEAENQHDLRRFLGG